MTKEHEVVAIRKSRMGISDKFVPKGTKGVGHKYKSTANKKTYWHVKWKKQGEGQHPLEDIREI